MVKVFKKSGSKNYYFQIVVDGRRVVESTRTKVLRDAMKRAEERIMELKLKLDYSFYLKKMIKMVDVLSPNEKEEAIRWALGELNSVIVKKVKLDDAFELFKAKPRKRTISARGYEFYESSWKKFTDFIHENFPDANYLSDIDLNMAEKFLNSEWKKGIAERTYNDRITKFRTMFSALADCAGLRKNVWQVVDKMREGHISKRPFSKSQLNQIFSHAEGSLRTLCLIGLYTGLRLGDAATLKWSEIDFEKSLISRLPNKTRNLQKILEIPLLGNLKKELEVVSKRQKNKEIYVLPDMAKRYLSSPASLSLLVQSLLRQAGIKTAIERSGVIRKSPIYGFHSFRHSFVSLCAANGIPVNVVMELVGHRSLMVHEIYQHASSEQKIKAIKVIEKEFLS